MKTGGSRRKRSSPTLLVNANGKSDNNSLMSFRLAKIIKQNCGKVLAMEMAPNECSFSNLCAVLGETALYIYDTNALGEGHFDLQSYLLLSKELKVVSLPIGIENSICWVIPPLPDDGDAIIAVVLNDSTLWMISLACSLVIKEITNLPMIPSKLLSLERGILNVVLPNETLTLNSLGVLKGQDEDKDKEEEKDMDKDREGVVEKGENNVTINEYTLQLNSAKDKKGKDSTNITSTLEFTTKISCARFISNGDGEFLAVGFENGEIHLIDTLSLERVTSLVHSRRSCPINAILTIGPSKILVGDDDGTLWLYERQ